MGEHENTPKLPIMHDMLMSILASAAHSNLSSRVNFEAAVTTAFSWFLRCGEFMIQTGKAFDPSVHIMRSSVQFMPSITIPLHVIIIIPSSKTDPFRKGVAITIASAPGACTCTVATLKALFEFVGQLSESPLYMQDNGTPLSWGFLISQVRAGLTCMGFKASKFSGHSFCHGMASSAAAVSFNNY